MKEEEEGSKVTYLNADCSKKGLGHLKSRKSSGHRDGVAADGHTKLKEMTPP